MTPDIRKIRRKAGISMRELSRRVGVSITHMHFIETGKSKGSVALRRRISKVLEANCQFDCCPTCGRKLP